MFVIRFSVLFGLPLLALILSPVLIPLLMLSLLPLLIIQKGIKSLRKPAEPKPQHALFPQFFANQNGLWIFRRDWRVDNPKGVVIISHGTAEHIQRYEHVARALNKAGYSVHGIDHQSHGMSESCDEEDTRTYVNHFSDWVDDLLQFSDMVRSEYESEVPFFLFGHSLGGLIVKYAADKRSKLFNGIIYSSPGFGIGIGDQLIPDKGLITKLPRAILTWLHWDPNTPFIKMVLKGVAYLFPKWKIGALPNNCLSHDPEVLKHALKDPLHNTKNLPAKFTVVTQAAMDTVFDNIKDIRYPFLIFGGTADQLVDTSKWEQFYCETSTAESDKDLKRFDGSYHETFNEDISHNQNGVLIYLIQWIEDRITLMSSEPIQASDDLIMEEVVSTPPPQTSQLSSLQEAGMSLLGGKHSTALLEAAVAGVLDEATDITEPGPVASDQKIIADVTSHPMDIEDTKAAQEQANPMQVSP